MGRGRRMMGRGKRRGKRMEDGGGWGMEKGVDEEDGGGGMGRKRRIRRRVRGKRMGRRIGRGKKMEEEGKREEDGEDGEG